MNVRPRYPVPPCPECGQQPGLETAGAIKLRVRLACECGVSGAWRRHDLRPRSGDGWHIAVSGWHGRPMPQAPAEEGA